MTENKNPQQDQQPKEPVEVPQPVQDTEFSTETNPNPNQPQMEQKAKVSHETKDKRGGNHNPTGANQYTSGRNDDRGRKE